MKTLSLQKIFKYIRFIVISVVVTTVDYLGFFLLFRDIGLLLAHVFSYSIAIVISFSLHKKFVFELSKKVRVAFVNVLFFSLVGVIIGYVVLSACNTGVPSVVRISTEPKNSDPNTRVLFGISSFSVSVKLVKSSGKILLLVSECLLMYREMKSFSVTFLFQIFKII